MKSKLLATLIGFGVLQLCQAQLPSIENLLYQVNHEVSDTSKLIGLRTLSRVYSETNPDSSFYYADQALNLARKMGLKLDEASCLLEISYSYLNRGNAPRALQNAFAATAILENPVSEQNVIVGKYEGDDDLLYRSANPHNQRLSLLAFINQVMGVLYANNNNYIKSWQHHLRGRGYADESGNLIMQSILNQTINRVYLHLKKNDSALISIRIAYEKAMQSGYKKYLGSILLNTGRTYAAMGNVALANEFYRKCLVASEEQNYMRGVIAANLLLAEYYHKTGKNDSSFFYIGKALIAAKSLDAPDPLMRTYTALNQYYLSNRNNDSAVKYQGLIIKLNDSLFNAKQAQQFQAIDFDAEQRMQEIQAAEKAYHNRLQKNLLLAGLAAILLVAIILFRNNKQKEKSNNILQKTLADLKSTQAQLVQSEKMASLGELTAGVAHEIQNPLNFINNFSEINKELTDELVQEAQQGKLEEVKGIAKDIRDNEEKINHHGKRADAIVKSMLQHSRSSSKQKELTDINVLAEEYLRLAYHGLRAKDKSFNAKLETDFASNLPKLNIVPQEIGRALLNLINNAFYTVNEKKTLRQAQGKSFEPIVVISTKKEKDKVEIKVADNGNGISQKVLDKIFHPFFTTKPTGQGTGLGLSLSYDIIKTHGGELRVNTKEGEESEFVIQLPID